MLLNLKQNFAVLFFAVVMANTSYSQAIETAKAIEETVDKKSNTQIYLVPEYYRMASEGLVLSGPALGFGLDYEFNDSWAGGVEIKHAYSSAGFSGLFLSTIFKARYALTGKFQTEKKNIKVKNWSVVENSEYQLGGFRMELHAVNYSVFASQSEVPFTGFGFSGMYEFVFSPSYSLEPGLGIDQASNSKQSVQAMRFFFRLKMRL